MLVIVVFAPLLHGQIGPFDELVLCVAPIIFVITVLVMRTLGERGEQKSQRIRKRHGSTANTHRTGKTR